MKDPKHSAQLYSEPHTHALNIHNNFTRTHPLAYPPTYQHAS